MFNDPKPKVRLIFLTGIFLFVAILLHAQNNFQITYSAAGDEIIEWIIPANDGNLILGGSTNSLDSDGDGLIIKTDLNGNIIWSKVIGGSGVDQIVRMIPCFDGGYVAIGSTTSYGQGSLDAWITRINEDGEVVWSDCFGTYSNDAARGILQTSNGDFIVVGQDDDFGGAFMLCLNSQGDLLWKKEYFKGIVCWFNDAYETADGGFRLIGVLNFSGFGVHDNFILQTNSTGNFISCKYYGGQDSDSFRYIIPYEDGFLIVGDTWSYQNNCLGFLAKTNSNLVIENAIVFGDININQSLESACIISNSICVSIKLPNKNAYIIEFNSDLTIKNSWQFNPGDAAYSSHIISLQDNSVLFSGSSTDDLTHRKDAYLTKFDPEEIAYSCNTVPHSTFIESVNMPSSSMSLSEINNSPTFVKLNSVSSNISLQTERLCLVPPVADFSGPAQVCAYESVSFTNNCQNGETYHWTFEGGIPPTSDSYNPGMITYNNPGYFSVKLVVTNQAGSDSITRYITVNPIPQVYLGEDTTLQEGETILLDAGSGMDNYVWQDGSSGQTFEVTEEGMYWVTVENNSCFSTDTIFVTYGDCLAAFYCNDEACVFETVSITNYCKTNESYQWYFEGAVPETSTSNDPGFVHYEQPGAFMIKLVVTNNDVKDSVIKYIDIYPVPEVNLGGDTIVAMGQSLILDAGPYMDNYLWQDGSAEQTFEAVEDGMYWVRVIENNCIDFDTIFITFDDCIASLKVPNCFTPNSDGFNDTFKAESQNLIGFTMLIYNRWGQQLFESEDPEYGWDGKVSGQLCPIGTYFYLIRYATKCSSGVDKDGVKKGSVTLLE
jgi:gliding motility-associated-like protein